MGVCGSSCSLSPPLGSPAVRVARGPPHPTPPHPPPQLHVCVVYGDGAPKNDGSEAGSRNADVTMSTVCDSSALAWDVKDDPVDTYTPATSGDRLTASHNWVASLSDGWCAGPISTDDRGVAMDWSRVSRAVGVNYQTYDAAVGTTVAAGQWTFAADQPGGPGGSIDAYGRKAWGGVVPTVTVRGVCSCP